MTTWLWGVFKVIRDCKEKPRQNHCTTWSFQKIMLCYGISRKRDAKRNFSLFRRWFRLSEILLTLAKFINTRLVEFVFLTSKPQNWVSNAHKTPITYRKQLRTNAWQQTTQFQWLMAKGVLNSSNSYTNIIIFSHKELHYPKVG